MKRPKPPAPTVAFVIENDRMTELLKAAALAFGALRMGIHSREEMLFLVATMTHMCQELEQATDAQINDILTSMRQAIRRSGHQMIMQEPGPEGEGG
jgi:hypothetical protein